MKLAKHFLRLSGIELERHGSAITLIPHKRRAGAWFSYRSQLATVLEKQQIDLVIDAGANEGQFAQQLRTIYRGEILSFEPVSEPFRALSAAAARDPKWSAFQLGLGSSDAERVIGVSQSTVFSSLLTPNPFSAQRFGEHPKQVRHETIQMRRLDEFLLQSVPDMSRRRVLLKLDTQGYDTEVFRGAERILNRVFAVQSELSMLPIYDGMPKWTEAVSLYEEAGLAIAGLFPVSRDQGAVIEYDCLLVRREPAKACT